MPAIDKPDSQLTAVKWRFPSVHPDGRKYVLIAGAATFFAFLLDLDVVTALLAGLSVWVAVFFRDPVRTTPSDPKLVIAPADGLVTMITRTSAPLELAGEGGLTGEFTRVSIFMSVFDVHINRSPIAGRVRRLVYVAGKFIDANLDKASEENERQHLLIERDDGVMIGFTMIAGLVARRILSFVKEGDTVSAGERIGLIRFGSRVDVYLPAGTGPQVLLGQRAIAGETVIGVLGTDPGLGGVSQ